MRTSKMVLALVSLALSVTAVGCHKAQPDASATAAPEDAVGQDALIEEHENGSIAWVVNPDGQVKALVRTADGKPAAANVSGSLAWKGGSDAPKMIVLAPDAKAQGLLVATGPKLDADLTEVGYTVTVDGKPLNGTLHLPPGGTAELVADARAAAKVDLKAKIGPHGGPVQVVGNERYEIVADDVSGEVRVYLLDPEFKAVAIGERKITVGVVADTPQIAVLVPEPEMGLYARAKLNLKIDPPRLTLAVRQGAAMNVAIVGWSPDVHLMVGAKAPTLKVRVKAAALANVDTNADFRGRIKIKAPDADVKVKIKEPDIKIKEDINAKAKVKAGAGAGANAGASAGGGAKAKAGAGASAKVKIGL